MKKIFITLAWFIFALNSQAQDITPISNAIKAGNADVLTDKMATEVDIVVPGASKKSTGNEAIAILKSFFQTNRPDDFTVAHHAGKNESGFFVGKLTSTNKEFRVNITYTSKDGGIFITVIRIE